MRAAMTTPGMYYLRSMVAPEEAYLSLALAKEALARMIETQRKVTGMTVNGDRHGVWTFSSNQTVVDSVWITDEGGKVYPP
jgi:hypothetical protein